MNKIITTLSVTAAALALSSCSSLSDFAPCLMKSGDDQKTCVQGVLIDKAVAYLADSVNINSQATADDFASKWKTIQTLIKGAQTFGVDIPSSVKNPYNKLLQRMASKKYYGSNTLYDAMANCQYL